MTRCVSVLLFLIAAAAAPAYARQAPEGLTDQQRLGRQLLSQSCGVCHLPPARGARTYGPPLGRTSTGGDDALLRKVITDGTARMPAFKYFLQPAQIDAIVAYVRTVSTPAPSPAPSRGDARE